MNRHEEMRRRAEAFHADHPEVWALFVRFTFEKIEAGHEHYGVGAIIERVRWETDKGGDEPALKFNNNFRAFYARRFARMYPDHASFFRFRRQISQDAPATRRPEPKRHTFDEEVVLEDDAPKPGTEEDLQPTLL